MGGKAGGGADTPDFIKNAAQSLGDKSQKVFDLSRPLLEKGTSQIASLIRTGGPGANVPIISNAVAAQETAGRQATSGLEGAQTVQQRGNVPTQFSKRTNERIGQATSSAMRRIPVQAAAPLIGASASSAISGGRAAQTGFTGAANALAAGTRVPTPSASRQNAGGNIMQALLFGAGGGFGGGGFGGGKVPNQQNPFGSGMSPTGGLLIGPGGTLGGGV